MYLKQNRKCAISGLDIGFASIQRGKIYSAETTASLDRIDSDGDYVSENVQWVHKDINKMKGKLDQVEFVQMCRIISAYRRCQENIHVSNEEPSVNGITIPSAQYRRVIRQAKERGIYYDKKLKKKILFDIYLKQSKKCALSGLDICFAKNTFGSTHGETTASLDRIDGLKGYIMSNIQWVHKKVNIMKNNLTEERFVELCKMVSDYPSTDDSRLFQTV